MSVYTRKGDQGKTKILDGQTVNKSHQIIKTIGALDELNAYLGLIRTFDNLDEDSKQFIYEIQNNIINISAILADPSQKYKHKLPQITETHIEEIERKIDILELALGKQKNFIIPGANSKEAYIHIARTVCRRAETELVAMNEEFNIDAFILKFINRLSDYLFMLARKYREER